MSQQLLVETEVEKKVEVPLYEGGSVEILWDLWRSPFGIGDPPCRDPPGISTDPPLR